MRKKRLILAPGWSWSLSLTFCTPPSSLRLLIHHIHHSGPIPAAGVTDLEQWSSSHFQQTDSLWIPCLLLCPSVSVSPSQRRISCSLQHLKHRPAITAGWDHKSGSFVIRRCWMKMTFLVAEDWCHTETITFVCDAGVETQPRSQWCIIPLTSPWFHSSVNPHEFKVFSPEEALNSCHPISFK